MTTSASTTFSPSRRNTTRSTPCVLGCCGPMLITSSLVSNIAPWWIVGVLAGVPVIFFYFVVGPHPQDVCRARSSLARLCLNRLPACSGNSHSAGLQACLFDISFFSCLPQLEPVQRVFHEQLARTFERIVL